MFFLNASIFIWCWLPSLPNLFSCFFFQANRIRLEFLIDEITIVQKRHGIYEGNGRHVYIRHKAIIKMQPPFCTKKFNADNIARINCHWFQTLDIMKTRNPQMDFQHFYYFRTRTININYKILSQYHVNRITNLTIDNCIGYCSKFP